MHSSSSSKRFLHHASNHSAQPAARSTPRFSSQFSRTPSLKKNNIDEITSFNGDEPSSSPPLPSRLRFSSSVARGGEAIDDESDGLEDERPSRSAAKDEVDDDLSDLLYLERLRGTRPGTHVPKAETTPFPRKRRKLSNAANDAITISSSSSSSSPSPNAAQLSDDEPEQIGDIPRLRPGPLDELEEDDDDLSPTPARAGPPSAARFKAPAPPTPSPEPTSHARPTFKPHPRPPTQTPTNLPAAFSPSKRRGKPDYLPGGAATTVRGWILALAATAGTAGAEQESAYTHRVRVAEARMGRGCVVVRGQEEGERWVLVRESGRGGGDGGVRAGAVVGVKRVGGGVELRVGRGVGQREIHDDINGETWKLAILWDIIE